MCHFMPNDRSLWGSSLIPSIPPQKRLCPLHTSQSSVGCLKQIGALQHLEIKIMMDVYQTGLANNSLNYNVFWVILTLPNARKSIDKSIMYLTNKTFSGVLRVARDRHVYSFINFLSFDTTCENVASELDTYRFNT